MAAAYSIDLRERVIQDADAGLTSKDLAERYHVSRAWVDALKQRRRETGSITPLKQTKFRGRVLAGYEAQLAALVAARPDATLAELRKALRTSAGLMFNAAIRSGFIQMRMAKVRPPRMSAFCTPPSAVRRGCTSRTR